MKDKYFFVCVTIDLFHKTYIIDEEIMGGLCFFCLFQKQMYEKMVTNNRPIICVLLEKLFVKNIFMSGSRPEFGISPRTFPKLL